MKIVHDGIARNSVHKLFYKDGATALKDLAPSIESNFSLSGSSNKVPLALRLYEDFTLTLIKSLIYSSANSWIALKAKSNIKILNWSKEAKWLLCAEFDYWYINPFTLRSDWHVTSPFNINTLSSELVMRILTLKR